MMVSTRFGSGGAGPVGLDDEEAVLFGMTDSVCSSRMELSFVTEVSLRGQDKWRRRTLLDNRVVDGHDILGADELCGILSVSKAA